MNLADLEALVAVIDGGGLSVAAEGLGVTTSAVSRRITALERELGLQLLVRTTRSTEPTEAGLRVARHARDAIAAVRRVRDAAWEEQVEVRGHVRLLSLMAFGRLHLPPLLSEIRRRHPRLTIDLVLDDRRSRVLQRDFDLALVAAMPTSDRLYVTRVAELRSFVCAAPSYLEQHGTPRRPRDLAAHDCISRHPSPTPDIWVLTRRGRAVEVAVEGSVRVDNGEVVVDAVRHGLGIGRVAEFIAAPFIASGELVNLFPDHEMATVPLMVATIQPPPLPRRIRVVHDILVERFRQAPWET